MSPTADDDKEEGDWDDGDEEGDDDDLHVEEDGALIPTRVVGVPAILTERVEPTHYWNRQQQ